MRRLHLDSLVIGLIALAGASGAALAADPPHGATTKNLQGQGGEQQAWVDNPHMHAFYDLSRTTLAGGTAKIDVADYEAKSYVIFRAMAASMGADPNAMQDHLKLIPRQMVQIVKDDPKVLDNYKNFTLALMGPP
jgi:hypothetical protein